MTSSDYQIEHRHEYDTRLGMMGLEPADNPNADQHNMVVAAADAHIAALKAENRKGAIKGLLELRDNL
jgi:hypothetical protein